MAQEENRAEMNNHEQLCEQALKAINRVHSDTSVSFSETYRSLRDLKEHIGMLIDSINYSKEYNESC